MNILKITVQTTLVVGLAILMQAYSCIGNGYRGPTEKEIRKVTGFDAIDVSHGIDVYLTMGPIERVEVEAAEDILEDLVTEVRGGVLKIYFDRSFSWNREAKVWVDAKEIHMINTSGGADLRGENVVNSSDLELSASGGSDIKMEIIAKRVEVEVSGGADITLSGTTDFLKAHSSGGSDLNAYDLVAQKANLEASGGSDINVHVEEELDGRASGGADISYTGNPNVINTNTSAGGDIIHRD